jgi:hypothetical protein
VHIEGSLRRWDHDLAGPELLHEDLSTPHMKAEASLSCIDYVARRVVDADGTRRISAMLMTRLSSASGIVC